MKTLISDRNAAERLREAMEYRCLTNEAELRAFFAIWCMSNSGGDIATADPGELTVMKLR